MYTNQILTVDGSRFLHMTNAELRERLAEHGCYPPKAFGKVALADLLSDCIDNREANESLRRIRPILGS